MTVGELLENYKGEVVFYDANASEVNDYVAQAFGGSSIIDIIKDMVVVSWAATISTKRPKIEVFCEFTPAPTPEPTPNEETISEE